MRDVVRARRRGDAGELRRVPPGELPREHVEWLRSLRLSHDDGRRFFVHAGIDPDKPLDAQDDTT